jgi:hypothetical protein
VHAWRVQAGCGRHMQQRGRSRSRRSRCRSDVSAARALGSVHKKQLWRGGCDVMRGERRSRSVFDATAMFQRHVHWVACTDVARAGAMAGCVTSAGVMWISRSAPRHVEIRTVQNSRIRWLSVSQWKRKLEVSLICCSSFNPESLDNKVAAAPLCAPPAPAAGPNLPILAWGGGLTDFESTLVCSVVLCPPKKSRPIITGLVPISIGSLKTRDDPGWLADTQLSWLRGYPGRASGGLGACGPTLGPVFLGGGKGGFRALSAGSKT